MKRTLLGLAVSSLAVVGIVVFGFSSHTEAGGDVGAKASFVKGTVEIAPSADGPFQSLRKKKPVKVGYFVRTGADSRVELSFSDGSVLRLGPESLLEMQAGQFNTKTKEARLWQITAFPANGHDASKDFMRWVPASQKQNTVPKLHAVGPNNGTV